MLTRITTGQRCRISGPTSRRRRVGEGESGWIGRSVTTSRWRVELPRRVPYDPRKLRGQERMRFTLTVVATAALLVGCGEKPTPDGCSPAISPTGHAVMEPHPRKPTSCGVGILNSNYCTYDGDGRFKG